MSDTPAAAAGGHRPGRKRRGRHGSDSDGSLTTVVAATPLLPADDADSNGQPRHASGLVQSGSQSSRSEACLDPSSPPQAAPTSPAELPPGPFAMRSENPRHSVISVSFGRLESARSEAPEPGISGVLSMPGSTDDAAVSRRSSWWKVGAEATAEGALPHGRLTELLVHKPETSDFADEQAEVQRLSADPAFTAEHEADPGFTLLHYVALLGQGTLGEALASFSRRTHHRFSRLAECLVKKLKHDVYVVDKYGCTPLQLAAACGNVEMVEVLLAPYGLPSTSDRVLPSSDSRYAYLNHQDEQIRFSALHGAVNHAQHDVVIQLLRHGANPQVLDNTRLTAFQLAPSMTALQRLLRLVLRHADEVPRSVIVQLMSEMLNLQGEFHAAQMWTKVGKYASSKPFEEGQERFGALALEVMRGGQNADVGATIRTYFKRLQEEKRSEIILEYLLTAIKKNHGKLAEIMIDTICADCPRVLLSPKWHETLEPLVTSFPTLFHRLLYNLQRMCDEDVRSFVRCLSPSKFDLGSEDRASGAVGVSFLLSSKTDIPAAAGPHGGNGGGSSAGFGAGIVIGARGRGAGSRSHAVDRVKLLIYQQLVEGLKKVSYRIVKTFFEESDQRLLNDMAQFPIFAEFVGLVANMDITKATEESDTSRDLLMELLRPGLDDDEEDANCEAAAGPAAIGAPSVPSNPTASRRHPAFRVPWLFGAADDKGSVTKGRWDDSASSVNRGSRPSGSKAAQAGARTSSHDPYHGESGAERWLHTLNVRRVLRAAVVAGKADNVEATVESVVSWVETNSMARKAVFLAGVTSDLIKALATRFPSACATLLNLLSKDVLEQLDTLQVPANVLYGKDHLVKCSHVRNHFTWREQELRKLRKVQGYDDSVVDALVDYGVPFECVYKAAVEMGSSDEEYATPEQFAALIENGFTGPEIKQLISNGIRLAKVIGYIEECAKPLPPGVPPAFKDKLDVSMAALLREMLRERLSPRIVDVILREERMFETTKYNNFRPGCALREVYPEPLFVPTYTQHFVQMLLINWRRGAKNSNGKVIRAPWAKEFIDTVFEPNDPLCTKLKSAYDNKLTDTHVYIQGETGHDLLDASEGGAGGETSVQLRRAKARQEREQALYERQQVYEKQLRHVRHLLSIFVSNPLLLHRWPVYLVAQLGLLLQSAVYTYWQQLEDLYYREKERRFGHQVNPANKARMGTIDAAVLVFPILDFFHLGRGDMLTALVDSDAPSSWFNFTVVRALYTVHWGMFGSVMVMLNVAVQLQFAGSFLAFFLLVLNCDITASEGGGPNEAPERLVDKPCVLGSLCASVALSACMLLERLQEAQVPQLATWVSFGRQMELCCHAMVWAVATIVYTSTGANLVPALSGLTMLLFMVRLTLFGLVTDKLSTAVLALLEILSDSKYFFLLIGTVYGGFMLAVAGLRAADQRDPRVYSAQLFTVLFGDFTSTVLTEQDDVWRYPAFSLVLLSVYAILMLMVFMNLLIATMNDTYDRVKEFCEVEVMRLRSHMMVFVKDFMERTARAQHLEPLEGEALHLLLRPEAVKSSRLLTLGSTDPSADHSSWVGRITYMRSTIVREVTEVVRQSGDAALAALGSRLDQVEEGVVGLTGERLAALERRLEGLERNLSAEEEAAGGQLASIHHQLERLNRAVAALGPGGGEGGAGGLAGGTLPRSAVGVSRASSRWPVG